MIEKVGNQIEKNDNIQDSEPDKKLKDYNNEKEKMENSYSIMKLDMLEFERRNLRIEIETHKKHNGESTFNMMNLLFVAISIAISIIVIIFKENAVDKFSVLELYIVVLIIGLGVSAFVYSRLGHNNRKSATEIVTCESKLEFIEKLISEKKDTTTHVINKSEERNSGNSGITLILLILLFLEKKKNT